MKKIYFLLFTLLMTIASFGQDLLITGVFDGPLPGGFPKAIELYVVNDIPDMSIYGMEIAGNGGASTGIEYTFPADAYTTGDFIYISRTDDMSGNDSAASFLQYFGIPVTYLDDVASHNGDDTIILYENGTIVDSFGEIGVDGTGTAWESLDGWAYRVDGSGPTTPFIVSEWGYSGINAVDGCDLMDDTGTNAMCASVFPIGTYSPIPSMATTISINSPSNMALLASGTTSVNIEFTTANLNAGDQVDITVAKNGGMPTTTTDVMSNPFVIMATADGDSFVVTAAIVNGMTQVDSDNVEFSIDLILDLGIVINEVLADPAAGVPDGDSNGDGVRDSADDEFVEIYNTTGGSIDMEGFTLGDGFGIRHTFTGTVLPSGGFLTVFGGGMPTGISGMVQTANEGATPTLGLNNGGDTVTLRNDSGTKIAELVYGGTSGLNGGNNQSLAREPDFTGAFVEHTIIVSNPMNFSPGANNDGTLSTNEFSLNNFSIYPNPVSNGKVTIVSTNTETISVAIFDILGKQIKNETLSNNTLDVSNLNTGFYILKISQNNTSVTKRLVIR